MSRRDIERARWVDYVDSFSRRHDGWLVSLMVDETSKARRYVARDVPLRGVVAELGEGTSSLIVFTGNDRDQATHFVENAATLEVEETREGADAALTITDESGARTILQFRTPVRPELVDGIA